MKETQRILNLIEKIERSNFTISEQDETVLGTITDGIGSAFDGLKTMVSNGIPYLVDKVSQEKILEPGPFNGKLDDVVKSTSKLFVTQHDKLQTNTSIYNLLIILSNFIQGLENRSIVDGNGKGFETWEGLEALTYGIFKRFKGGSFNYEEMWSDYIEEDDIDDVAEFVTSKIESSNKFDIISNDKSEEIQNFLVEFFESGKSFTAFWNNDRLDGDWETSKLSTFVADIANVIETKKEDGDIQSELETYMSINLPCYKTAKYEFKKLKSGMDIAVKKESNGIITVTYLNKEGKLSGSFYHKSDVTTPIGTTTNITCGGGANASDMEFGGLNEQTSDTPITVKFGEVSYTITPELFSKLDIAVNGKPTKKDPDTTTEPETNQNDTTTDTTTEPETNQNDTTTDTTTTKPEEVSDTPNTDKLKLFMVEKGASETLVNDDKRRAQVCSLGVSTLLRKTVTTEEYMKSEEDIYAEKAIESIDKKMLTFTSSGKNNFEKQAEKEEKIIDVVTKIEEPTPIEIDAVDEIGDDAVAKSNNELKIDAKRIKKVRITSDDSKVVYVANEDITDIISDIEIELEGVYGGDWYLDKTRNKFMSKNKLYVFIKKEE